MATTEVTNAQYRRFVEAYAVDPAVSDTGLLGIRFLFLLRPVGCSLPVFSGLGDPLDPVS